MKPFYCNANFKYVVSKLKGKKEQEKEEGWKREGEGGRKGISLCS